MDRKHDENVIKRLKRINYTNSCRIKTILSKIKRDENRIITLTVLEALFPLLLLGYTGEVVKSFKTPGSNTTISLTICITR